MMRFGSVCSGIEAASVAWHELGWEAAWLAEVDVSASAVLAHRFAATAPRYPLPGTEKSLKRIQWGNRLVNWGDMTRLPEAVRCGAAEAPDILCGGTPCQGFSLAGLRGGLDDPRGQLTLSFVELANAIDDRRAADGKEPCVVFWENVPGVRSDAGNAFGHFLAALVGVEDPVEPGPRPQPGRSSTHWTWKKEAGEHVPRWPGAGAVAGPRRSVAWRSSDAQYAGLAQRRERVFLVASAREGFDPQVVLFEFDSLRRDIAPSRDQGQDIAGTLAAGTYGGGFPGTDEACSGYVQPVGRHSGLEPQWWDGSPISQTLDAVLHKGQTMPEKNRFPAVLQPVEVYAFQPRIARNGRGDMGQIVNALQAQSGETGKGDAAPCVAVVPILEVGARTGASTTDIRAGIGIGIEGDPMFTLQSSKQHGVAVLPFNTTQITSPDNGANPQWGDPCFSLAAGNHPPAVCIHGTQDPDLRIDLAHTLGRNSGQGNAVCVTGDITHALKADGFDGSEDGTGRGQPIIADYLERRHADAYEADASSILSTLLETVGSETYGKWGFGILAALQSPEILQSWLHGASLRSPTKEIRSQLDDSALSRSEDSAANRLLRQVWEHGPNGCSSQGRGLAKQLAGKSGEALSVLSHQGASGEDFLRIVRKTTEGVRLLLEALSAFRQVGRPENGDAQWGVMSVRRLMPIEAERLMGFPDNWTSVPVGKGQAADSPRYKQLGNSWAVPCVTWIGKRLDRHLADLEGRIIDGVQEPDLIGLFEDILG